MIENIRQKSDEAASALPALMARAEHASASIMAGDHARRRAGQGEKFWQFREYDPSDRPQDIDWRQSGRTDRVYVRQKESQTSQTVLFWAQRDKGMDYKSAPTLPSKHDDAAVLSLALGMLLTKARERIGLIDGGMRTGASSLAIEGLGQHLCTTNNAALPAPLQTVPQNAYLIFSGDFLSPLEQIEATLAPLAARTRGALVIQTLDPAELTLPFSGRVIFESMSAKERHRLDHVESVRADYQARIAAHIETVSALCRSHGWHYLLHRTDEGIQKTLLAAWEVLDGRTK